MDAKKLTKEDEVMTCPGCQSGQLQKTEQQAKTGSVTTMKIVCDKCGLGFLQEQNRFKLIQLTDGTSIRLVKCLNNSFSLEQWRQIAAGASLRYEEKSGSYVPNTSDVKIETKPIYSQHLSETRPSTSTYANEKSILAGSISNSEDLQVKRSDINNQVKAKDRSNESRSTSYVLTVAGKYFLRMSFDNVMEINHLLRCVQEKIDLAPEKLKILVDAGLLVEK